MLIYIAGPMTKGLWEDNTRNALDAAAWILRQGHTPVVPHLYTMLALVHPGIGYERYLEMDFELVSVCKAVLRIDGESNGANREIAYARNRAIPVYTSLNELHTFLKKSLHATSR